jgi:major membrane immunogen (membrane-anchored lipoprotein)
MKFYKDIMNKEIQEGKIIRVNLQYLNLKLDLK